MSENKQPLLSIYGARVSNDGQKLILVLVAGENENKQFYNACIKLDGSQRTTASIDDLTERATIETPLLAKKGNDYTPF